MVICRFDVDSRSCTVQDPHCALVPFVRKADAERAIEKMQRFPVGGSWIRLSWGQSQCEFFSSRRPFPPFKSLSPRHLAASQALNILSPRTRDFGVMSWHLFEKKVFFK